MGSFAFTCAVSNLPIEVGDPVRYMLVTENPYNERACYQHDNWFLRTLPFRAVYNDYGSIDKFDHQSPECKLILQGLKVDLYEQGWGDNSVHDVPTRKTMKFPELLEALWEGRVSVQRKAKTFWRTAEEKRQDAAFKRLMKKHKLDEKQEKPPEKPVPFEPKQYKGVPSLQSVDEALVEAALKDGRVKIDDFMINEEEHGVVRVRWKSYSGDHTKQLTLLLRHLTEYATVIRAGTGSYANRADLFCFPKPGADYHGGFSRSELDKNAPLLVDQMMIREDVWQQLLKLQLDNDYRKPRFLTFKQMHESMKVLCRDLHYSTGRPYFEPPEKPVVDPKKTATENVVAHLSKKMAEPKYVEPKPGEWIFQSPIPFTMGIGEHIRLLRDKGPITAANVRVIAETAFVSSILATTRHMWRPSTSAGPQFGIWKSHKDVLGAFSKAAAKRSKKQWG